MGYINADKIEYLPDSLFSASEKTGLRYIEGIDADRLLAPLFEVHSLPAPNGAVRYSGWERKSGANWFDSPETFTLAGHSLGHYMSALAKFLECGCTGFSDKADYIVSQLDHIQRVTGSGYIGGCKEDCFTRLFSGDADRWADGYWVPWYNVHKIYKGLIDIYSACRSETALRVLLRFADWAVKGLENLSDVQFEKMLETEYGGMNEVFANLYELTGNSAYLELAVRFTQKSLLRMLTDGEDRLDGLHANTQIPKVIGMAAIYRACPDRYPEYRAAAEYFWQAVVSRHSYAIGGNSVGEHFESADRETLTPKTCESCNSYNMMRLTRYLYGFSHKAEYFDWYERALYNHILPQQESETGAKMYFVSLLPGHHKTYEKRYESWWCCTGTGMENPAKYRQAMFYGENGRLYINLYSPCRFAFGNLVFEMQTDYPYSGEITLSVTDGEGEAELFLRIPSFSDEFSVSVDGKAITRADNGYARVRKLFKKGDKIIINLSLSLLLYRSRKDNTVAFTYGPLTLAARLGSVGNGVREYISNELDIDGTALTAPKLIAGGRPICDLPVSGGERAHFIIPAEANTLGVPLSLVPFGEISHEFYSVYFSIV